MDDKANLLKHPAAQRACKNVIKKLDGYSEDMGVMFVAYFNKKTKTVELAYAWEYGATNEEVYCTLNGGFDMLKTRVTPDTFWSEEDE